MSTEYKAWVVVGFLVPRERFLNGTSTRFNDEDEQRLEEEHKCSITVHGNSFTGDLEVGVSSKFMPAGECLSFPGRITFSSVIEDLDRIKKALEIAGYQLGEAKIHAAFDIF